MTIQSREWRPLHTCGCFVQYAWDDTKVHFDTGCVALGEAAGVPYISYVKVCKVHEELFGLPPQEAGAVVTGESQKFMHVPMLVDELTESFDIAKFPYVRHHEYPQGPAPPTPHWYFTGKGRDRVLHVSTNFARGHPDRPEWYSVDEKQKKAIQKEADKRHGRGRVVIH